MVVVDTSIWAEFLKGNEPIFGDLSTLLEDNQGLALECVFAEMEN